MYFTFSKEPSFGQDSTSQDYTIDLLSDDIVTNVNYVKFKEFNQPTFKARYPSIKTSEGRVSSELTYGNEGWNLLFECLVGQRLNIPGHSFARSSERWNIITGMLAVDITDSETSFNITEYKEGEFDNIEGIIVGSEYIAVSSISAGVVSLSSRASEGSTAASHSKYDLVYGVAVNASNSIDIISRYKDGFSYSLPSSVTALMNRNDNYFKFNGVRFSDYVFKATPDSNTLESSLELVGINTDVISLSSPSTSVDSETIIDFEDINCYCMNEWLDVEKIYFQISNTLKKTSYKFFDTTYRKILLSSFSAYGQFSLVEESLDAYNSYIGNDIKNVSITMCNFKQFSKAYVFAFNDVRYGTMLHMLRSSRNITDSVPFYAYGPEKFIILIQN